MSCSLSQARSVFSSLIPPGQVTKNTIFQCLYDFIVSDFKESEFFGIYLFAQLSLTWLGSLTFVAINENYNSLRLGVLVQIIFILPAALIQVTIPELKSFSSASAIPTRSS